MCMKYLVNREDLGKRITGYIVYNSETKEFTGLTEKVITNKISSGDRIYGLVLNADGKLEVDKDGFKTTNYMVRSGINSLSPIFETDSAVNIFYIVVAVIKNKTGIIYEVVNSRYGRTEITEQRLRLLYEFGAIQGGVYLDKNKLVVCEGVAVIDSEVV